MLGPEQISVLFFSRHDNKNLDALDGLTFTACRSVSGSPIECVYAWLPAVSSAWIIPKWNAKLHHPIGETEGSKIRILFDLSAESVEKREKRDGIDFIYRCAFTTIILEVTRDEMRNWDKSIAEYASILLGSQRSVYFFRFAKSVEQIEWIVNSSNVICGSQHSSTPSLLCVCFHFKVDSTD